MATFGYPRFGVTLGAQYVSDKKAFTRNINGINLSPESTSQVISSADATLLDDFAHAFFAIPGGSLLTYTSLYLTERRKVY